MFLLLRVKVISLVLFFEPGMRNEEKKKLRDLPVLHAKNKTTVAAFCFDSGEELFAVCASVLGGWWFCLLLLLLGGGGVLGLCGCPCGTDGCCA